MFQKGKTLSHTRSYARFLICNFAPMKKLTDFLLILCCIAAVFSCGKQEEYVPITPPDWNTPENSGNEDAGNYGLADLAMKQGIKLGAAFTYGEYSWNPQVAEILSHEFKAVTFGNEMKHDAIVQNDGTLRFNRADEMAAWAKEAGCELFGHVLGWHSQQKTAYLNTLISDPSAVDAAFKAYVYGMVEHFDVYAWDVVNETFADGAGGAFRTQGASANDFVWGNHYPSTKDWVDAAFAYATEACAKYGKAPVLYINDYNLETDQSKRRALCNYAKGNPNVTGVASQMHLDINIPDLKRKVKESLTDLAATGKMVRISELDLKNNNEEAQADMIKYIFEQYLAIVPAAQRGGITFWGINDKDSWLGENNHPLLWKGTGYEKKKVYEILYLYLCELNGINPNQ